MAADDFARKVFRGHPIAVIIKGGLAPTAGPPEWRFVAGKTAVHPPVGLVITGPAGDAGAQ